METELPPDPALKSLADIALPPPVSYMPQTWGWAALAILALLAVVVLLAMWLKHRRANRYRREALAELDALIDQGAVSTDAIDFQQKLAEIVKRTALAAWKRETVAGLAGAAWAQFIAANGPGKGRTEALTKLVDDREYSVRPMSADERAALAAAAHEWIEKHHVSA